MNIISTQYTASKRALEIYIAGCKGPHCIGCHNPESWDFKLGKPCDEVFFSSIRRKMELFDPIIHKVMIFGGEPLDQDLRELEELLMYLLEFKKEVWLFTRYGIDQVPIKFMGMIDYVKCGRYLPDFATEDNIQYGVKLATSNQKIYSKQDYLDYCSNLRNQ